MLVNLAYGRTGLAVEFPDDRTTVIEPRATRDHTERMLCHFGATVHVEPEAGGNRITVTGQPELIAAAIPVPVDVSSAAFPLTAALLTPGSEVTFPGVGMNTGRIGLIDTLRGMGADITMTNEREEAGEPAADLRVRASRLEGVEVPASRAPSMIDEYPILAVAASAAHGRTVMRGLGELRVKESDRLSAIAAGLAECGVRAEISGDDLTIEGCGGPPRGGGRVATHYDHRIAMSFLVLGTIAQSAVTVDDGRAIDTSFPGFAALMNDLGARIAEASGS